MRLQKIKSCKYNIMQYFDFGSTEFWSWLSQGKYPHFQLQTLLWNWRLFQFRNWIMKYEMKKYPGKLKLQNKEGKVYWKEVAITPCVQKLSRNIPYLVLFSPDSELVQKKYFKSKMSLSPMTKNCRYPMFSATEVSHQKDYGTAYSAALPWQFIPILSVNNSKVMPQEIVLSWSRLKMEKSRR